VVAGPMGPEEGILYAECNLEAGINMKLRHDFAGHYNRPDIFQLHINRDVPQLYTVHAEPSAGALEAPRTGLREIATPAPALPQPSAPRPALGIKPGADDD
jgi:nitrilase